MQTFLEVRVCSITVVQNRLIKIQNSQKISDWTAAVFFNLTITIVKRIWRDWGQIDLQFLSGIL
jgi:hypothetical protein